MMWENPFAASSSEQLAVVLNDAPVAVLVSSMASRELLYANNLAFSLFLSAVCRPGVTCYEAAGYGRPCPFCQAEKLSRSELLIRNFRHPQNQRIYQLSGKLIDWNGKPAHIEYLVDITDTQTKEERALAQSQNLKQTFCSIPCGLCSYRYDAGKIYPISHNPAFYEIMDYSEQQINSVEKKTEFLGVHPDDLAPLKAEIDKAIKCNGMMKFDYRVWSDKKQKYGFIHLEGAVKPQEDGTKILYGVYSDISQQRQLEAELTGAKEKMQDIINAIPGGVARYKVADGFEATYYSDGVPALSGYSPEEYRELTKFDAAKLIYQEDKKMVVEKLRQAIREREVAEFDFRKQHRDGHIVWVHVQAKQVGELDGLPLLQCVFHNISTLKETQLEMDHLINSIPGGIASYRIEGKRFIPVFYSDGVLSLSGHTREELDAIVQEDAFNVIYEADRPRVLAALQAAFANGQATDISYRTRHKDGYLVWVHMNGRRIGPRSESMRFYAVFTGMSAEALLFKNIANETADGIYVIDKETYELLYINESKGLFDKGVDSVGEKCYAALHGQSAPCKFCTLKKHAPDGKAHNMELSDKGHFYSTRFRETLWNGIPAYVKYVQDITGERKAQKEKERLEQYFQTLVKKLPGGVAVVRFEKDGRMMPEYFSDGFATLSGMTMEEVWQTYGKDGMAGVHPDDVAQLNASLAAFIASGQEHCELICRIKKGDNSYLWVKNSVSVIRRADGEFTLYANCHDMTKEREEQEQIRQQYKDLLLQHYRTPGPNALIVGHCNVTQNRILEIIDHTNSDLLKVFGTDRQVFFTGLSSLIVDKKERQAFLDIFLNKPTLAAYAAGNKELSLDCFVKLPQEASGRYVKFKVNLVETPDTEDITGILTVFDITEQTISDRNLHQLSANSYDLIADVDLLQNSSTFLSGGPVANDALGATGSHSDRLAFMMQEQVVPKDKELVAKMLEPDYMLKQLQQNSAYSFSYSILGEEGEILTKKLTVSASDLRLGRICLARADITDSVREQQGLLNAVAYTFEMLGFVQVGSRHFTLYTRQTVLQALQPEQYHYASWLNSIKSKYVPNDGAAELENKLGLENMLKQLAERPNGYDFVIPYQAAGELRYKQINVLWGDNDHKTVCIVRQDVTDMLTAERQSKEALEKALALAEEASLAKSDFLSSMSHDIRTPMNAIIGMTALAQANLDNRNKVEGCLQKISLSSRHLLSLINDILDMSKIERSKITLNRVKICLPELMEQLSSMMGLQAEEAGLHFEMQTLTNTHAWFYGDSLRINQILINILSNAIKFTPEGGSVKFLAEELAPVKGEGYVRYRFTISDTGLGMSKEFMGHLFEPFTRSKSATRIEGTGLGLSITKGLLDLMEGELAVESVEHGGSVFRVELECEAAQEDGKTAFQMETATVASSSGKGINGRCFLVAEDNDINAEILSELLQMYGAKAVLKGDGRQALREFENAAPGTFDAILMDIQMPEMNGYDATRAIRKLDRADVKRIPIIAMTANAFTEDIQAARAAGMTAHIAKPIDMPALIETLEKLMF